MKNFKYLLLAFFAMVGAMTFVSCGDDDDSGETETTKASKFTYSFTLSEDVLSLADVTVNYIDAEGKESSEKMTETTWTKTLTANKFDVSTGVQIIVTPKSGVDFSQKEKYNIARSLTWKVVKVINGKDDAGESSSVSTNSTVAAANVEAKLKGLSGTKAFHIDADGKITTTTLSWSTNGVDNDCELEE